MESIERRGKIDRSKLSEEHYFQSLLEKAFALEMLSEADLKKAQLDCLAILAKQTELYNAGNSSIRIEEAKNILASIMFAIGISLKTHSVPDDAVTAVRDAKMESLFQQGLKRIDALTRSAKTLHSLVLRNLIETDNIFYGSTIDDAITGFFKQYNPVFGAHEIHITADYPVFNPVKKKAGIEFILNYLEYIYYENSFCMYFTAEAIHHLLCGYAEDYRDSVLNIYEPSLTSAIGCILSGANARLLNLTPSNVKSIYGLFSGKTGNEIRGIISDAFDRAKVIFSFPPALEQYVNRSRPLIMESIGNGLKNRTLEHVFIVPKYPERDTEVHFSAGTKMDDELYRKIIFKIKQSGTVRGKMKIMRKQVDSFADLEDILLDAGLPGGKIMSMLRKFNDAEIAVLLKKHPILPEAEMSELRTGEQILAKSLHKYVASLSKKKQHWLRSTAQRLKID